MAKDVLVYTKPGCGQCRMLSMWLNAKGIEFKETDILENEQSYNKIKEAGRMSLPVLEIEGEFVDYQEYNDILEYIN